MRQPIVVTTSYRPVSDVEGEPKYDIIVDLGDLKGPQGNAMSIITKVARALKDANRDGDWEITPAEVEAYCDEAMSGNYEHVLKTTCEYVNAVSAFPI